MPNVLIDKDKLDVLANAISAKSGEPLTLTLDEMVDAVDGIETGGGGITPTGNIDITQAGVTDVTDYATATVPQADVIGGTDNYFTTQNGQRKWHNEGYLIVNDDGWIDSPVSVIDTNYNAIASGTAVTPTETAQTIGGANTMMEGAVTVDAIPSNYVGSGITRRDSTDLSASGATVSVPSGFYENNASKAVSSGTEGTPTATKGTVTNHSVSITPSVTNSAGYISGGTHSGTAISVSASELVSGNLAITENGSDIDVANYSTVSVNVSGGGGSLTVATKTLTNTATTQTLSFTSLSGQPKYWFLRATTNVSSSGSTTYYYITDLFYDGTNIKGNTFRIGSTRRVQNITSGVTQSFSNNTLTITAGSASTATPGQFYGASNFGYELVYIY